MKVTIWMPPSATEDAMAWHGHILPFDPAETILECDCDLFPGEAVVSAEIDLCVRCTTANGARLMVGWMHELPSGNFHPLYNEHMDGDSDG